MADAAERLNAGGDLGGLPVATLEAMDRILATWETSPEGATA